MRNLTQSTYDRICRKLRDNSDRYPQSLTSVDAKDLLLAYEGAMELLDGCLEREPQPNAVGEFLYLQNGEPRVELEKSDDDEIAD